MVCWAGQYPQRLGHAGANGGLVPLWVHWGAPFWRPVAANHWVCRSPSAAGGAGWGHCVSFLSPVGHGMGFCSFRSAVRVWGSRSVVLPHWEHALPSPSPSSLSFSAPRRLLVSRQVGVAPRVGPSSPPNKKSAENFRTNEKHAMRHCSLSDRRCQCDGMRVGTKPVFEDQHSLHRTRVLALHGDPLHQAHEVLIPVAPEKPRGAVKRDFKPYEVVAHVQLRPRAEHRTGMELQRKASPEQQPQLVVRNQKTNHSCSAVRNRKRLVRARRMVLLQLSCHLDCQSLILGRVFHKPHLQAAGSSACGGWPKKGQRPPSGGTGPPCT